MKTQEQTVRACSSKLAHQGRAELVDRALEVAFGDGPCPFHASEHLAVSLFESARILGPDRTKAALAAKE